MATATLYVLVKNFINNSKLIEMKAGNKTVVSLQYQLEVEGEIVDQSTPERPLTFPFGVGYLLPKFEANVEGLEAGDKFAFTLTPEEGYGPYREDMVVELPKETFMINGVIEEGLLDIGNQIPLQSQDGARFLGVVKAVDAETVTIDLNAPMAGKTLNFSGEIISVRELTAEEEAQLNGQGGCGCGCGCEGGDCSCDDDCDCSCHD